MGLDQSAGALLNVCFRYGMDMAWAKIGKFLSWLATIPHTHLRILKLMKMKTWQRPILRYANDQARRWRIIVPWFMMFIVCIWCFTMVFCVHVGAFGDLQILKFPALYLGPLGPGPSPRGHGPRSQPAAPSKRLCRWDPAPGHRQGEPLVTSQDAELFFDFAITFAPFHLVNLVRPRCIMCNIYNYIYDIYIYDICVFTLYGLL